MALPGSHLPLQTQRYPCSFVLYLSHSFVVRVYILGETDAQEHCSHPVLQEPCITRTPEEHPYRI